MQNSPGTDSTGPIAPSAVTDDGAYTTATDRIRASWTAGSDPESGIASYKYAIGTTPGGNNIKDWTTTTATSVTVTGLSLTRPNTYYVAVKAVNGAGAESAATVSDGIQVASPPPDGSFEIAVLANGNNTNWDGTDLMNMGLDPYTANRTLNVALPVSSLTTQGLASVDVLILPTSHDYSWLDSSTQSAIVSWVNAGGTLIVKKPSVVGSDPLLAAFGTDYEATWSMSTTSSVRIANAENMLVRAPNVLVNSDVAGWASASGIVSEKGAAWQVATDVAAGGSVTAYAVYGNGVIVFSGQPAEIMTTTSARKQMENWIVIKSSLGMNN